MLLGNGCADLKKLYSPPKISSNYSQNQAFYSDQYDSNSWLYEKYLESKENESKRMFRNWAKDEYLEPLTLSLRGELINYSQNISENSGAQESLSLKSSGRWIFKRMYNLYDILDDYAEFKPRLRDPYITIELPAKLNILGGFDVVGSWDVGGDHEATVMLRYISYNF
tara:strand:- start:777 stop:1280 length:504 start_codon:yes stop_codon:yes gene_type:complete